ncbi:PREDICTED: uncharacterized protein LOC109218991 [Nicotiana attenuata]|uniref:uncharacterized protein LOC109218991 n=1 Tax=Nicotiana attenuata TaxID=49451 RepID=UPI000904CE20|nr:PREDICTED: uncharacterized protein LOC109218991 [Nicotiana attenuata]
MEIDNQQLLHRNTYGPEEQVLLISQVEEEQENPIYDITMEKEIVIPVEDQHIESLQSIEGRKRKEKGNAKESPSIILKENASLDDVKLGSVFQDKNAMIRCFCLAAIKEHFEFYVNRSSNTRYSLVCTDEKCTWTVRGSRIKESTLFKIVKFQRTHECSVDIRKSDQRQATSNVIRDYVIDNLRDIATEVKPKFVILEMKRAHGIDVGYGKAWHAIQKGLSLLRGTTKQNYEQLPSYLYMMEQKNPGSYTNIVRDEENSILYRMLVVVIQYILQDICLFTCFFMYGALISGWKYCRPLIAVDGTFLKNKYRGVVLVTVTKDANNQIFPIAFGVVDKENNESYEWYFRELRKAIGIRNDLIKESEAKKSEKHCDLFQSAARVYLQSEFDDFMSQIAVVDKKTFNYLMEEPPGRTLAEGIFRDISNWAEATLEAKIQPAFTFRVLPTDRLKFNVKEGGMEFIVDLDKRTCDCSEFQLDEMPCEHAIAAIESIHQKKSAFCSAYFSRDFWLKTYEGQVNFVGDATTWVIPDTIKLEITKPPDAKVLLGRRQKNRHVSGTEFKKEPRCSRCKKYGHTRTNCTNSAVVHPYARKYRKKND